MSERKRGRSKATMDLLEACKQIVEATAPITVRGICYRLFVADHIDSMAVKNTQKISRLLTRAREESVIDWDSIVDESREMETVSQFRDLEDYGEVVAAAYRRDFWAHQRNQVIVISEKATVAGILRPVLREYGVTFFPVHGFNSATKMHDLAYQISCGAYHQQHFILIYVGDHDPSGMYMSEADLPERLNRYGATAKSFKVERIALMATDTIGLPSFEAKQDDPRYRWYLQRYGQNAWELDAMDPNQLRDKVEKSIKRYIRVGDWKRHKKIEQAQRETTERIAKTMAMAAAGAK